MVAAILIAPLLLTLPNAASSDPVPGVGPDMTRTITWNFDDPANFTTTDAEVSGGYGSLTWSTYSFDHDSETDYSTGVVMDNIDISSEPGSIIIDTDQETIHTLTLQPGGENLDAYIREDTPDSNSGVVANLVIDGQSGRQQRPILWFNLSSLPANAAVLEGNLFLYLRNGKESPVYYTAYAMSRWWNEFTVTWNSYESGLPWTTAGGDFDAFPFGRGVLDNTGGWHRIDLSRMIDLWLTNRLDSFGVILVPDSTGSESSKTFVSSDETTNPERRPVLMLNYTLKDEEGNYESAPIGPGNNTIFTTASWATGVHSSLTDEFSGMSLSDRWSWTNEPIGVGEWDVGSTIPGWLHMSGEGNNFLVDTNVGAHYVHENATGSFDASTYVSTSFTMNTMGAGLLMLDDDSNWFATVLVGTGSGTKISAIATEAGSSTIPAEASWAGQTNAYLRMIVNESSVMVFYCSDGIEWLDLVTYNFSKPLSTMVHIGLCLYSGGSLSNPHANFDFLRVEPLVDRSSCQMMVRLGDSKVPGDPSWGAWSEPVTSPYVIDTGAKYLQYRLTLVTGLEWYSPSFDGFYCGHQMYPSTGAIETMDCTVDHLRRWLTITCAEELNGGTVNYSYSTDHGDSWSPLLIGVSNSISDTAPYMKLKMELATTDTFVSPSVDFITAQYSVAASSFHVSAPSAVVAGEDFSVTVEARDENDATIDHWTGLTALTAVDENGTLPASGSLSETTAYISAGGIVIIWDEVYTVAETIRIMVSAEGAYGLSAPITVLPGATHHLNITPEPDEVPEYSHITFKATAHDLYCNPVTGKEYAWHADESIGTLNSTSGQFVTLQTGEGRQDGDLTVTVEEISHSIFLKVVPPMYPPEIAGSIEEQVWPEDYGSWSLNISSMVSDFEDAWMDMRWYVTNEWLVTVSGENRTGDMTVNLTTKPNLFGSNVLRLVVVDSDGMTASTDFVVTITPVNDPPSIDHIPTLAVTYDVKYEFDFRHHISDVDNAVDELILSVDAASTAYATVKWLAIEFLYPAALNGTQKFVTVTVSDGTYPTTSTTLIVSISSNKVPFSRDIPAISLNQGQTMAGVLDLNEYFDDLDDSMLFYSAHSDHVGVTIQPNHTVDLEAPIHWWGVEYVIFTASDNDGARCEEVMMVTVLHVNQPPSIEGVPDLMVMYELRYDFDLTPYIFDADNPTDTLHIATDSSYIAVIGPTISLLFPRSMDGQTVTVVLSVSDGELTESCSIAVGVSANRPPQPLSLPDHEFLEDGEVPYPVGQSLQSLFVDPDGYVTELVFSAFTCTSDVNATAEPNDQGDWYVWLEVVENWNGICRLTVRAVDPQGALAERTVQVNVIPQPDQPVLREFEPITMQAGTQKMLDLTQYASDPDSETEKFAFIAICDDGKYADLQGGVLVLSFPEDFLEGNADSRVTSVEVTVIDEDGYTTKGVILVTVTKAPTSAAHSQQWFYVSLMLMGGLVLGLGMVAFGMRRRPFIARDMMLIHNDGFLISRYARPKEGEIDEQVLSSMLTAVLNFVDDSMAAGQNSLKTFGFRDYHVMVERGNRVFAAIAYEGDLPEGIDETLDGFLATVEKIYKKKLEHWSGDIETDFAGVEMLIQSFVQDHFRRRKVKAETVWKTRATDRTVRPRRVVIASDYDEREAKAQERKARFTRKGRTKGTAKTPSESPPERTNSK